MCSERSRTRRAVGSCERLASCGRAPRSACNLAYNIRRLVTLERARRGMKTVESSAVFQPKQWAEKEAGKTIENRITRNCAQSGVKIEHCSRCPFYQTRVPSNPRDASFPYE